MKNNSQYIYKDGKKLRTGYTTGSCAAAAAKAAAWMLCHQDICNQIKIDTPKGWQLILDVQKPTFNETEAKCCIIKDSGDDPDITNGIEVFAKVTFQETEEVTIIGGKGVGRVTQKGLQVPVGHSAINPTPMKMIQEEVRHVIPYPQGVQVEIELPKGEALAKKTFNPRLGIEGGLSILGTTGIVEPMSQEALKDTIKLEFNIIKEKGYKKVVLVPGNIGEKLIETFFNYKGENFIKISNYLGYALDLCVALEFDDVLIAGHIGKLIKPAGGTFYTHNRISSTRMEILTANLALLGMANPHLIEIMNCRTTEEAMTIIEREGYKEIYPLLVGKIVDHCEAYCFDQVKVHVALFSMDQLLAKSNSVLEMFKDEQN
ncbi:cobalt-precorrin 5B C1-methyltransferase [Natranaerovirga pectinivora]|uniref:Cobalt-precorrin-5B C(1)-methyltransferase n=1 Tax=Natranaerovirga pectinivora TaxID=682400 RepID=A0A4R3MI62_9FIRM|nr:cobalt-precorrin-5B (C(1))-methyltransferase CbiD [Natranaerovirga pectinivora]TCT13798.1 cobalt-precorrin 5B C1-methyltransferase [Natranaerovirga pectinivora]